MKTHYRNKKILEFAKGQPCQHCGTENGTTVACHSNTIFHGKGVGIKADDCYIAYLCNICHERYDKKLMSGYIDHNGKEIRTLVFDQRDFDRAMQRTMKLWLTAEIVK